MPPTTDTPLPLSTRDVQMAERIGLFLAATFRDAVNAPDMQAAREFARKYRTLQKVRDLLPDSAGAQARYKVERDMADLAEAFVQKLPE